MVMGWSSFGLGLASRKRRLPLPQRRCCDRVCYQPHPKVLPWSRIVETGKLMAANAPRVRRLDVLLSESSANGCSWGVRRSDIRLWSQGRNLGLPPRAASTYHTASNYQTRDTSDEDRLTWAEAGRDRRPKNQFAGDKPCSHAAMSSHPHLPRPPSFLSAPAPPMPPRH